MATVIQKQTIQLQGFSGIKSKTLPPPPPPNRTGVFPPPPPKEETWDQIVGYSPWKGSGNRVWGRGKELGTLLGNPPPLPV